MQIKYKILHYLWRKHLLKKSKLFKFISFSYTLVLQKFIDKDFLNFPSFLKYDVLEIYSYLKLKKRNNLINQLKIEDLMETRGIDLLIEMKMFKKAELTLIKTFNFGKNFRFKTYKTKYLSLDGNNKLSNNYPRDQILIKPKYLNRKRIFQNQYKVKLNEVGLFHVNEKSSVVNGWHVINEKGELLIHEKASRPGLGFSSGLFEIQWPHESYGKLDSDHCIIAWEESSVEKIQNGILLGPRVDNNYFKFLIDYISRLKFLEDLETINLFKILINKQDLPQLNQIIKVLGDDFNLKEISRNIRYELKNLIVPTPMNYHPDTTNIPWRDSSSFHVNNLIWLKNYFFKKFMIKKEKGFRKIYINSSRNYRKMENQAEICNFFESQNYEIIDPSQLTFEEQVSFFSQASHVCGATGAWIANMVFMPVGSRITVLISKALKNYMLHSNMAHALDLEFEYLTGSPRTSLFEHTWREGWLHSDFSINLKDILKIF